MRRHLAALVAALAVVLTAGTGAAIADTPTQAVEQAAATGQSANSSATSTQYAPSNSAVSVRIGSPGSGGSVSQSNDSAAGAAAGNLAGTEQQATQDQSGAGGTQAAAQDAATYQSANADATSTQDHPSNSAISVRIGSPGNDGDVSQSNSSAAAALAGNAAGTSQDVSQDPKGSCGCASAPTQAAQQAAKTEQSANADATSKQDHPSNSAISVRIGSPGNDGDVSQSNDSKAVALAGNLASTRQSADQEQGSGYGGGTQAVEQAAATKQRADSSATSEQYHPSNDATSVRIGSPGSGGSVRQSNDSAAFSAAGNLADTTQDATQDPRGGSCGCGGNAVQAAGQFAFTGQSADSNATSKQIDPSNSAKSVRIGSYGNDGDVTQSNTSLAGSFAGNAAFTDQSADQEQGSGGGTGVQALEQKAATWQNADSNATSLQFHPSNDATGVRIASPGSGGSVDQSNTSLAGSFAGNLAATRQDAMQTQSSGCGCGGDRVQAIGQFAFTGQSANSDATSLQKGASNSVTPVSIGGYKDGGYKDGGYKDGGYKDGCGCRSQEASPCGCDSGSSYGDIHQANDSAAFSAALNAAATDQYANQSQGSSHEPGGCGCEPSRDSYGAPSKDGPSYDVPSKDGKSSCGCSSPGVQAVGQFAATGQRADSSARSEQWWPSNSATPVRIGSPGSDGSIDQSNTSLAKSLALNLAFTRQAVVQQQ